MFTEAILRRHFSHMGARVQLRESGLFRGESVRIDVGRDGRGEFFDIRRRMGLVPELLDVRARERHLLLMVRHENAKNKFLLGHDERHWFAAAVPGKSVRDVRTAIESLRPAEARGSGVVRQGEWFFIPAPHFNLRHEPLLRQEPLSRGAGSKPHLCEELVRRGGETVMVSSAHPMGIALRVWEDLVRRKPSEAQRHWQRMVRDPEVYARGRIRHSDHKTIVLDGWHRVLMNTERLAPHAAQIAFLD